MTRTDTLVIGAGQAGLATSYHLTRAGRDHLVVDAATVGDTWRTKRWDSFTLVTPTWTIQLPGPIDPPGDPDGFIARDDIVDMLERYATAFQAPVREATPVERLERNPTGAGFVAHTPDGPIEARQVVVAVGFYQVPRLPPFAKDIASRVHQIDTTQYRNPESLPPGGVLVVGSAQSGTQIAEDLHLAGRNVWLSVGSAPSLLRKYRGRDSFHWWNDLGKFNTREHEAPDPRGRFAPNPHVSGARGGHTISLHRFARDGIRLIGRVSGADGERIRIEPDLYEQLGKVDGFVPQFRRMVDEYAAEKGLDVPPADATNTDAHDGREGYDQPIVESLDLEALNIGTIIWACGFVPDYSWIKLPIFDDRGQPIHTDGITNEPGLAFVGVRFQRWAKSDLFLGVGDDAEVVVDRLSLQG